ncbi:MAG TPA: AI-2E family transporter [Flavobacteriales bacterium]|nr:AI-2E family transporter [Flavobacteriales bacterium]
MNSILKMPVYAKASIIIIGFYFFINILFISQDIILPIIYAMLIATLLNPVVNFLANKKVNRVAAILIVLCIVILVFVGFVLLISLQVSRFSEILPRLNLKLTELQQYVTGWAADYFSITEGKINEWVANTKGKIKNSSNMAIGTTLSTAGGVLATLFLTPVYVFMLLFYKPHLIEFLHRFFGARNNQNVNEFLTETKKIVQQYINGLFYEFTIIAVLNFLGLLLLGIDYAILLGVIGALLNVIPYLGGLLAMLMFMLVTLVTKSPEYVLYVVGLYTLIQFIDNNYIVPKVVGSKVKLNAFICLIAVIIGAALWGIPGMFLAIPLTAIVKLVLDRIEPVKPWGFLLGHIESPTN